MRNQLKKLKNKLKIEFNEFIKEKGLQRFKKLARGHAFIILNITVPKLNKSQLGNKVVDVFE